jgi:hypothetical protein
MTKGLFGLDLLGVQLSLFSRPLFGVHLQRNVSASIDIRLRKFRVDSNSDAKSTASLLALQPEGWLDIKPEITPPGLPKNSIAGIRAMRLNLTVVNQP